MNLSATRRELLAGLGALAIAPPVLGPAPLSLRALFDQAAAARDTEAMLAVARHAPADGLDRVDRILLQMVVRGLEREWDLKRRFPFGKADGGSPYVLSQRHGAYLQIEAAGGGSAEAAHRLDEETERLRAEAALGLTPPDFILDAVVKSELELRSVAVPQVRLALDRQIAELRRLRASAASAPGVWRLHGGEDYFGFRLRCTSGLDHSPEELEMWLTEEIAALVRRADGLLRRLGLRQGSIGARLRALKRRPGHVYSNDEEGRTRAVADMNAALARLRPRLGAWFDPPLDTGGSVRRMSAADERAQKRGYRDPATKIYYPDLAALEERPAWTLTTVAYHETIPGHLLQLGRQERADPHPLQVEYAPGYSEGWAIYAESLADSAGLLSPVEQLGFIQSQLFRLARVTCDIGIHLRRWDRARAIRYLEEIVGFELFFPFAVEVDRYAAEPAAFAGDAMVARELRRLGKSGRTGGPAALRDFHDAVLNRGPVSAGALPHIV